MRVVALITCFNKEQTIEDVICKAKACKEIDNIIVYDDASTDGSVIILKRLAALQNVSVLFGRENIGVSLARNLLMTHTNINDIVVFCDGDDKFIPEIKDRQIKIMKENQDFVFSYSDYVRSHGSRTQAILAGPYKYGRLRLSNFIPFSSVVVRLKLNFSEIHHEDYLCWLQTLKNIDGNRVYYHSETTFIYSDNGNGISSNLWKGFVATIRIKRKVKISYLNIATSTFFYMLHTIKKRIF